MNIDAVHSIISLFYFPDNDFRNYIIISLKQILGTNLEDYSHFRNGGKNIVKK